MRLFIAIDIPDNIRNRIQERVDCLRPAMDNMRWSRTDGLHITLKFLGEVPPEKLELIRSSLSGVTWPGGFSVEIRDLGLFPTPASPRILWLGIDAGVELAALARLVEDRLTGAGFARESRPFSPHLTIGRFRTRERIPAIGDLLRKCGKFEMGKFTVQDFHLFESQPTPGGSIYRKIVRFPLAATDPGPDPPIAG